MKQSLLSLLLVFIVTGAACSKGNGRQPDPPGTGTIHGVRMVIPAEYKFFGVEYEGDDIWANPPKRHRPGPDVPIRSFAILLHLPDYAPLNEANDASWAGLKGHDAKVNEWTNVGIEPIEGVWKDTSRWFSDFFIKRQMEGRIEWRPQHDWYFEKQPGLVHGLVNEKIIGPDYSKISVDNVEIFYDPRRSTTYIVCGTGAGGTKFCQQAFLIPELGVLVDMNYAKNNLKNWEDIQQNVRRIVLSFKQN